MLIWLILIIIAIFLLIYLWFSIPYSPLKSYFRKTDEILMRNVTTINEKFDILKVKTLPKPIQNYLSFCGFINKPMMKSTITTHKDADFILSEDKPKLKINYTQVNYANIPCRLAFIDSKIYSLPFQGLDSCIYGEGGMKGVLAKIFKIFDVKSKEMDISSLVTVLAESLICPSILFQNFITFDEIDDNNVKVTITYNNISASGIFTFSLNDSVISFKTSDRYDVDTDGKSVALDWTAECSNFQEKDGIKYPTSFKGIWNRKDKDLVYFHCNNVNIQYRY